MGNVSAIKLLSILSLILSACDAPDSPNVDSWPFTFVDEAASESGADGVFLKVIDGIYYVVTPWQDSDTIRLCEGNSKNNWDCSTIGFHESPEFAFFINELDVVSCGKEGIKFHYSPDWETFTIPAPEQEWNDGLFLDVDGDGQEDIVAGGDNGILGWFKSPSWEFEPFLHSGMGWEMGLHGEDLDGDGDLDFIVSDRGKHAEAGVSWFENPTWERHQVVLRKEVRMFDIYDLDGNGFNDVVVGAKDPSEVIIAYAPSWEIEVIPVREFGGFPKDVAVGDIDLDGSLDIVVTTGRGEGEYYLAGPDWQFRPINTLGAKDDNIILYDFDLDGDLDLMTAIEIPDLGVLIFWNKTIR